MWLLSFFNKVVSYAKWLWNYFNKAYIFPELNEKSLVLARSIKLANKDAAIVFTSVSKGQDARSVEMVKQAKKMRAICFRSDILRVNFNKHSPNIEISFFTIGGVESENFDLTMKLVQLHKDRNNVFVFTASGDVEGEMLASGEGNSIPKNAFEKPVERTAVL